MNLYEFFNDNHYLGYVNYLKLFSKLSGKKPRNPVIFLFDNELEDNTKPISKFMSKLSDKSLLTKLKQEQYVKLTKEGNLYLVTLPLQIGQNQCEIENLFLDDLLSKELGGKRFCLSGQYDRSEAFGKDTFSKYILEHYQDIDFQRFKPVLDNFKLIIKNYKMD